MKKYFVAGAFLLASSIAPANASYPSQPVTVLIPFSPGGATDLVARAIASVVEDDLGQPFVIVNRPGAGGATALNELASAEPDGYTIGIFNAIAAAIGPHMQEVPFNSLEDFTPIMNFGAYTTFVAVPENSPFENLGELIAYANDNPRALTVGVSAIGASSHLGMARLASEGDADVTFVPFGGGAPAVTALLGGHLAAAVTSGEILPHVRSGDARILAMLQDAKVDEFPQIANIRELGYDWDINSWLGFAGPADLDSEALEILEASFLAAMETDEFRSMMNELAMLTVRHDRVEAQEALVESFDVFGDIVKNLEIGIYAE